MAELYTITFCRWVIGLTFAFSALGKATALAAFRDAISDFELSPPRWSGRLAVGTVLAETLVALLVAAGSTASVAGFALGLALLLAFSALLVRTLRRRSAVSCNCFGRSERPVSGYDVARNGVLAICCLAGCWADFGLDGGAPTIGLIATLALMAATLTTIVTNLADIVELLRKPYVVD